MEVIRIELPPLPERQGYTQRTPWVLHARGVHLDLDVRSRPILLEQQPRAHCDLCSGALPVASLPDRRIPYNDHVTPPTSLR